MDYLQVDDRLAVCGSRQHILNSKSYSPSKIYCFEPSEMVTSYSIIFLMRNDFILSPKINEIVQRLFESGVIGHWSQLSKRKRKPELPYIIPLKLTKEHMYFAMIFIMSMGSFLAILILIQEIYVSRKMKQANKSRYWTYLEWILDDECHFNNYSTHRQTMKKITK